MLNNITSLIFNYIKDRYHDAHKLAYIAEADSSFRPYHCFICRGRGHCDGQHVCDRGGNNREQPSSIRHLQTRHDDEVDVGPSGQVRGYLLTRDEAYAQGVETDKADVKKQFEALRAQVRSPERQAMLAAVERAANGFIDEAAQPEIRLARDPSTFNQGLNLMTSGIGKRWMNEFKGTVKTLSETETDLRSRSAAERVRPWHQPESLWSAARPAPWSSPL